MANKLSLPTGWKWTTLGEAFTWSSGGTPLRSKPEYYGGDIPWAIIGDLNDGIINETQSKITHEGLANSSAKWVDEGSVLLAMYGSIGKLGLSKFRLTTNQAIAFTKPEKTSSKYLFYYLMSQRKNLKNLGMGATQQNISQTIIKACPIPIAPCDEQERIVARIEELFTQLDAGTAALKRVQAGLKRYKASVLKAAVEGKLVPQDPDDEPAEAILHQLGKRPLESEDLPELPNGWCWSKLHDITKTISDVDHKMPKATSSEIPYISTRNFYGEDEINFADAKRISEEDYIFLSRKIKPEKGDILLSRYGTIGEIRRVKVDKKFQASYSIAIIKPLPINEFSNYLFVFLRSILGQEQMRKNIRASSQPDLGITSIREFTIPLPPSTEQSRIVIEIERINSVVRELDKVIADNLRRATYLRQSILNTAFTGTLL